MSLSLNRYLHKNDHSFFYGSVIKPLLVTVMLGVLLLGSFASAQSDTPYRLGPEDVVMVNVMRHIEFSGEFFIPGDGTLVLPAVGNITASGKTLDELAAAITEKLKDRLRDPEVTVSLKTPRMQRVYIVGSVSKSGPYDMKPGWRITEALAAAGGLAIGINQEDCKVNILRASTGAKESVALVDVLRGSPEANLAVESGDVITIDPGETIPVYVTGKVKTPGLYRIRKENQGIMSAIALAGGLVLESATNNVQITRLDGTSQIVNLTPAAMEGKEIPDVKIQPGDMIVIPEATARIAVLGFVKEPGFYTLRDGIKVTLSDALGMAKGMDNKRAGMTKVAVLRTVDGSEKKMVFDMQKFLKKGDVSQNPEILTGDVIYVPETNKIDYETLFRSVSAIGVLLNPLMN
ncbi:MAG: polysaccharide biosynthesis/export family protein [Armatimonadota bacterium]